MDKAQYFLLKALLGDLNRNIMMVGDPNQSIFAFNGSSPDYMQKQFVEEFSATIHYLTDNDRCSRTVINASNKLMNLNAETVNYVIPGEVKIKGYDGNFVTPTTGCARQTPCPGDLDQVYFYDTFSGKLLSAKITCL